MRDQRNPARLAMMLAEYPHASDPAAFLARLNSLPGTPIASVRAVSMWALKIGIRKTPDAVREAGERTGGRWMARGIDCAALRGYERKPPKPKKERAPEPYTVTAPPMRKPRIPQPVAAPEPYTAPIGNPGWAHRIAREVPTHRPEDLTPEQEAEIADAALERRLERARDMIARKMAGKSAAKAMRAFEDAAQGIIANTRLPAAVVRRLAGEVRMGVGS